MVEEMRISLVTLPCTGQPPPKRIIRLQMSTVLRPRNPDKRGKILEYIRLIEKRKTWREVA